MENNTAVEVQNAAVLPESSNQFKDIIDKWFEDRRAEEIRELNEYDEKIDTYENFVMNLYECSHNSTQQRLVPAQNTQHFPGDKMGPGPDQIYHQQMVNLAKRIKCIFNLVDS
ncbi:unnamed protein product [Hermetia illucens]|uniref:Uncharacterized protein n=1 Tax=Hermetia illucens TaxID=343691 RepID=A0A7R8UI10_HERIL|nr:unnamed protein product [Hermetia illucens]